MDVNFSVVLDKHIERRIDSYDQMKGFSDPVSLFDFIF